MVAPSNRQPPQLIYRRRGKKDFLAYVNRFIWEQRPRQEEDRLSIDTIDPDRPSEQFLRQQGQEGQEEGQEEGQGSTRGELAPSRASLVLADGGVSQVEKADWPKAIRLALFKMVQSSANNGYRNVLLTISGRVENLPENLATTYTTRSRLARDILQLQRMAKVHQVRIHVLSFESEVDPKNNALVRSYFRNFAKATNGNYFSSKGQDSLSLSSKLRKNKQRVYLLSYDSPTKAVAGFQKIRVQAKYLDIIGTMNTGYAIP